MPSEPWHRAGQGSQDRPRFTGLQSVMGHPVGASSRHGWRNRETVIADKHNVASMAGMGISLTSLRVSINAEEPSVTGIINDSLRFNIHRQLIPRKDKAEEIQNLSR